LSERRGRFADAKVLFRAAGFVLSFIASAASVWLLSGAVLTLVGSSQRPLVVDIYAQARKWRRSLQRDHVHDRVALIGDSVLLAEWGNSVPVQVRNALWMHGAPQLNVQSLGWPGLGPISEYCLADEIISAKPDLIVLEVNLRGFVAGPLGTAGYPELAGHIKTERLLEAATLPLSDGGITLDRLLFYRAIVASGFESAWVDVLDRQARLVHERDGLEEWIDAKMGGSALYGRKVSLGIVAYARSLVPGRNRATRARLQKNLWPVFEGLPPDTGRLRVLGAALRTFRRAGIPVLVWLAPANVQHFRYLGLDIEGLGRSAVAIRQVVEAADASFVDLHFLLPDDGFADSSDHVTMGGPVDGAAMLGDRLALEIVKALRDRSARTPGERRGYGKHALQ
jgi:hypothetical protein